jgi:microcystin-dependent protein
MANFPGSLDNNISLPNPNPTDKTNAPSLSGLLTSINSAVIAVETKLGTSASTSVNNKLLVGTGPGTSAWAKDSPLGDIVGTSDAQTLTNKNLTSPAISSPVISGNMTGTFTINGTSTANLVTTDGSQILTNKTISTGSTVDSSVNVTAVLEKVYPVGAIYMSTSATNPATVFGFGTWTAYAAGRTIVGVGTSDQAFAAGATGGASNVTLTTPQMPVHNHGVTDPGHTHTWTEVDSNQFLRNKPPGAGALSWNGPGLQWDYADPTGSNSVSGTNISIQNAGGTGGVTQAHNNLQPYIVTYIWQRTA